MRPNSTMTPLSYTAQLWLCVIKNDHGDVCLLALNIWQWCYIIINFYLLCVLSVSLCGVLACLWCSSLANRSVHAAQWSSSCVLWRAAGPGWVWRSSWRGSAATSRVPSRRKRKATASGVAARRTLLLVVTHLLKTTIFAACRYLTTAADTKAALEFRVGWNKILKSCPVIWSLCIFVFFFSCFF